MSEKRTAGQDLLKADHWNPSFRSPGLIRVSVVSEDGERVFIWISVSELQQTDASSSWRTFIWTADKIRHSVRCEKWMCWRCVLLFEADVSLFMSADECWMLPEEQPDGSFPVGRVWQLGLQDLTGHSAGESGRRSHYHPAQTCHGGGYVHVKTRNWLKHSRSKIYGW